MNTPESAVCLIYCKSNQSFLLLKRADNPRDPWSGHWALPGGRQDPSDQSLLDTAIRECREECGLTLLKTELSETLPIEFAGKAYNKLIAVQPFFFEIASLPELTLQEEEIASYNWLPQTTWEKTTHRQGKLSAKHPDLDFFYLDVDKTPLWGFTYQVIKNYIKL